MAATRNNKQAKSNDNKPNNQGVGLLSLPTALTAHHLCEFVNVREIARNLLWVSTGLKKISTDYLNSAKGKTAKTKQLMIEAMEKRKQELDKLIKLNDGQAHTTTKSSHSRYR